jgi:Family of unknown function (DUF6527)
MRLTELHPRWENNGDYLVFDCPKLHEQYDMKCEIILPVRPEINGWDLDGRDFATLTISPSIWHHCSENPHFFIRKGEIQYA